MQADDSYNPAVSPARYSRSGRGWPVREVAHDWVIVDVVAVDVVGLSSIVVDVVGLWVMHAVG